MSKWATRTSTALMLIFVISACGTREASIGKPEPATKNLAPSKNSIDSKAPPLVNQVATACSPLGAIYRSNPVVVPPPEENAAELSYSGGDCSFYAQHKNGPWTVTQVGSFTFEWSTTKKTDGAVIEMSRDGIEWKALATSWTADKPSSATATIPTTGKFLFRARHTGGPLK